MGDPIDLATLDRDVRRATERLDRARTWLASDDADAHEKARSFDPWADELRAASGQTTYRNLAVLEPLPHDLPLRDALRRWVYEHLQARIGMDLAIDDAEARTREDPDKPDGATYATEWRRVLRARDAHAALARLAELAPHVAAVRKERRERRAEIAHRLELADPASLATKDAPADLAANARALLDATEPLATSLLKEAAKKHEGIWRATDAIHFALAKDARDGWPAKLTSRWLGDAFKAIARGPIDVPALPDALGGASFVRGAAAWGFTFRAQGAARSLPFALARDPYPASAHRFGFAMAAALASTPFQKRVLGLPVRLASAQARALGTSIFFGARMIAAAMIAGDFEEITFRLFGAPLPRDLAGAWPAPRIDTSARFVAMTQTRAFVHDLVARFDEDWFANPRAGTHLVSLGCAPAWDGEPAATDAASFAKDFEESLG